MQDDGKGTILERRKYYCAFGPEDNSSKIPSDNNSQVQQPGQRRHRKEFGQSIKRGCQASFSVVVYKEKPQEIEIRQAFVHALSDPAFAFLNSCWRFMPQQNRQSSSNYENIIAHISVEKIVSPVMQTVLTYLADMPAWYREPFKCL